MKKLSLFALVVALLFATAASAQKIGYISVDQAVGMMPELGRIDTVLQRFQADSLQPRYAYIIGEYQRKDSQVNGKDSAKFYPSPAVRSQVRNELEGLAYQIQNWQQFAQQEAQRKQNELLEPVYRKVMKAINDVSKEAGYSHIMNKEAMLVAPPADDILPLVAKKLNIKLPAGAAGPAPVAPAPKGKQ